MAQATAAQMYFIMSDNVGTGFVVLAFLCVSVSGLQGRDRETELAMNAQGAPQESPTFRQSLVSLVPHTWPLEPSGQRDVGWFTEVRGTRKASTPSAQVGPGQSAHWFESDEHPCDGWNACGKPWWTRYGRYGATNKNGVHTRMPNCWGWADMKFWLRSLWWPQELRGGAFFASTPLTLIVLLSLMTTV
uniref:Uncharacterized protein n=1 Tax=Noctiluca scintillans TaxID=2966 RepID=A0A7S1AZR9_NOCSC